MLENTNSLDSQEVETATSEKVSFEKQIENSIEKIEKVEAKANPVEKKAVTKATAVEDRVIYSTKSGIIPNFGQIDKGYTKLDKNKAKVLVNTYSFIRYASEEEIETYVN